jgi:hypothetical protein
MIEIKQLRFFVGAAPRRSALSLDTLWEAVP